MSAVPPSIAGVVFFVTLSLATGAPPVPAKVATEKGLMGVLRSDGNTAGEQDAEGIEGTWDVVECRQGGKPQEKPTLSRVAFVAGSFSMKENAETLQGTYRIDSVQSPKQLVLHSRVKEKENTLKIAFARKGERLVLCCDPRPGAPSPDSLETKEDDGRLLIILQSLLVRRLLGHTGPVYSAGFSRDGRQAVSGSGWPWGDRTVRLWEVATGRETRRISTATMPVAFKGWGPREVPGEVLSVAFSPDASRVLAGGAGGFVAMWDSATGTSPRWLDGHDRTTCAVAFSPDGRRVLSGGCDNLLRLCDVETGKEVKRLPGHGSWVRTVAFSPDGRRALSAGLDMTMRLWDLESGRELRRMKHDGWVWSVTFSPDGRRCLSACNASRPSNDQRAGGEAKALPRPEKGAAASSPMGAVWLWDLQTGAVIRRFRGHSFGATTVAFSPDGRHAVSGGYDRTVRLWDVETGEEICAYLGHRDWVWTVAFSPDGRHVLSGGGGCGDAQTVAPRSDFALRLWRLP